MLAAKYKNLNIAFLISICLLFSNANQLQAAAGGRGRDNTANRGGGGGQTQRASAVSNRPQANISNTQTQSNQRSNVVRDRPQTNISNAPQQRVVSTDSFRGRQQEVRKVEPQRNVTVETRPAQTTREIQVRTDRSVQTNADNQSSLRVTHRVEINRSVTVENAKNPSVNTRQSQQNDKRNVHTELTSQESKTEIAKKFDFLSGTDADNLRNKRNERNASVGRTERPQADRNSDNRNSARGDSTPGRIGDEQKGKRTSEGDRTSDRDGRQKADLRNDRNDGKGFLHNRNNDNRRPFVAENPRYRNGRFDRNIIFHDRPGDVRIGHRYAHVFNDFRHRLCYRIIWPGYYFWVGYNWGSDWTFSYVHPYYQRKYVFVSLGGWWPDDYCYIRYYWYGWHPYQWYGYLPVGYQVGGDTNNYYTYNYYNYDNTAGSAATYSTSEIPAVDHTTFADIREKLANQAQQPPAQATVADRLFEEGVNAFEAGNYEIASAKFADASQAAPDDLVLPFAYSQAFFALEMYPQAAAVLQQGLLRMPADKEGVFYPRGLYPNDDVLFGQIDRLENKAKLYPFDADLQLLLGYQMLGTGEIDQAGQHLNQASQDMTNAPAASVLLRLLEKMKEHQTSQDNVIEQDQPETEVTYMSN